MLTVFHIISRLLAALMLLFICLTSVHAAALQVAVVLSDEGVAYREIAATLRKKLDTAAFTLTLSNSSVPTGKADLYVVVGMKATASLAQSRQPVLSVLTPRAGIEALRPSAAFSAIYVEQPLARQLALLSAALPQAHSLGVLYATPPAELAELEKLSIAAGLTLRTQLVAEPSQLAASLSGLLEKSDALLVLPDAAVYRPDTIRNILLETYRRRVPMIGLSQHYVRAGALCAIYSTPEQIARQAAKAIEYFAATGRLPASQYPEEFEVAVNTRVARSLGLTIKDAEQLRASIRGK